MRLKRQADEGDPEGSLKGWKRDAYISSTNNWLTTSQILARVNPERAKAPNAMKQIRRALRELVDDHHLLEAKDSTEFQGEMSWRRAHPV